jgi:hypothetical protein
LVALRPLTFSQKGQDWRPHPRTHCAECGGGRSWYRGGSGSEGVREKPDGAFGVPCAATGSCASAGEVPAYHFRGADASLGMLDEKLLEAVLEWLVGRKGDRFWKREIQLGAGARALRALAACCRRGREIVTAARWVPGISVDLYPHQVAALGRCVSLEARRKTGRVCGGVLCDEAGLGKTITALALIARSRAPACPRIPLGATCPPL